jgi:phosphonopyruvate decarboxylase
VLFARVLIAAEEPPRVLPLRDGVALKNRFRAALGIRA